MSKSKTREQNASGAQLDLLSKTYQHITLLSITNLTNVHKSENEKITLLKV
jgi:hypothetical protein